MGLFHFTNCLEVKIKMIQSFYEHNLPDYLNQSHLEPPTSSRRLLASSSSSSSSTAPIVPESKKGGLILVGAHHVTVKISPFK